MKTATTPFVWFRSGMVNPRDHRKAGNEEVMCGRISWRQLR